MPQAHTYRLDQKSPIMYVFMY